jgi:hypothetical protein
MRRLFGFALFCLAVTGALAQQPPSGTLLPVMLDKSIDSDGAKPGDQIEAKLMQQVSLPDKGKIKRQTKVFGHVVAVTPSSASKAANITVQFDQIEDGKKKVPLSVGLRAFASMQLVAQARNPTNTNAGPGTSVWDLNVSQIGGQIAYNGQKIVKAPNGQVVGRVVEPGQIAGVPMANPERGCAGAGNTVEQAFWLFSTNACGVYGDDQRVSMVSGIGGTTPGKITFESAKNFTLRGGSAWLLQVN